MNIAGFDQQDMKTIWNFFRMFLRDRFLGSRLGMIWAIINPLMMLAIYTFVFAFVFKSRMPGSESTLSYTIWMIAGFGPWLAMSEGITTSASSIYANAGIVKNMAFKTECLPIAAVMVGLIPLLVSLVFLGVLLCWSGEWPSWHALIVIPAVLLLFAFVAALGLGLSALVVFYRDLGVALPNLLMVTMFATPILYQPEATPNFLQQLSQWNPFYILAQWVREPLVHHTFPSLWGLVWVIFLTLGIGTLTLKAFRRVKGYLHGAI